MEIQLKDALLYRQWLLKEYNDARLNFLEKKQALNYINTTLENNGIEHFEQFNGDYDLWESMYSDQFEIKEKENSRIV